MDELVHFLRLRLDEGVEDARRTGNMLIAHATTALDVPLEYAERHARLQLNAAEAQRTLFKTTVLPYLGTAGPTGRIAEQQIRIMGSMHEGHEDYSEAWRPWPE
ncbi:hypothetical protein [Streptomyces parvulus]|uniref:hypothetical protein n=1 Tax=Streptomyces parvulus TaxID=146923 RepID=UPI0033BBF53F